MNGDEPGAAMVAPLGAVGRLGKPAAAPLSAALGILGQLGLLRAVLGADDARAYFLGRPVELACALRTRVGVPCPMCGVTRAVALTLHGELDRAFSLFPAAPVAIGGLLVLAAGLIAVSFAGSRVHVAALAERRIRPAALCYAVGCTAIWLTDWTLRAVVAFAAR